MATLIKETGAIVTGANAYQDVDGADAYFGARLHTSIWDDAIDADKTKALIWASALLDQSFDWKGQVVDDNQPLRWPRYLVYDRDGNLIDNDEIPSFILSAVCELAISLLAGDRTADKTPTVKMQKADVLEIEYQDTASSYQSYMPRSVINLCKFYGLYSAETSGSVFTYRT